MRPPVPTSHPAFGLANATAQYPVTPGSSSGGTLLGAKTGAVTAVQRTSADLRLNPLLAAIDVAARVTIMCHIMKTTTIRELKHATTTVLSWVRGRRRIRRGASPE